ncbi:MAG: outer membrane beta-barrel protein [Dysgonomonas sp.]|uniref:outer membrane beta-barrel protein n=1 Tax=Dysgonomonas sp. TaxID=1891233 RepID=UPI0039E48346
MDIILVGVNILNNIKMLKKISLLVVIMLFASHKTFSQIEIRGGLGTSTITKCGAKNKLSFHIGTMYQIDLDNRFAIEPGLFFSMEGSGSSNIYHKCDINYLEVPVFAKFTIRENTLKNTSFKLGPYIAHAVYGSVEDSPGNNISGGDFFKIFNRTDFGLQAEISYKLGRVEIYVNYKNGLKKVNKYYQEKTKISNLRLGLGYTF